MSANNIKIKSTAGFTILEMIIALFIVTVGIGSVVALINQNLIASQITASKLVASYLAQEGIELVRNIRDTNWLRGEDWLDGGDLATYSDGMSATDYSWFWVLDNNHSLFYLCLGDSGFYFYNFMSYPPTKETSCRPGSVLTPFQRTITLYKNNPDPDGDPNTEDLRVKVEVNWEERGRAHEVTVEEILYDWK